MKRLNGYIAFGLFLILNNMTKKYVCGYHNAVYCLPHGVVTFTDRCGLNYGSIFVTNDKDLQKDIENHPNFKSGVIYVEEEINNKPTKLKEVEVFIGTPYPEVKGLQAGNEVLKQIYEGKGQEYTAVKSKKELLEKARDLNIIFPNLK